jgi:type IV pilus assembly protein PilM
MNYLESISSLLQDPPPAYAFEVSEAGIAYAAPARGSEIHFHEYEPGIISVSPARDNVQNPEAFNAHVAALAPAAGNRKRTATLILPDHSARVQILDFDSFPGSAEEQAALVRFRFKKSVPFDVDSAAVSYVVQPAIGRGKIEVIAAVMALEIVARYEAAFRAAGYLPGLVTISSLATLDLAPSDGLTVLAKLSGRVLSVLVLQKSRLKLVRTVELDELRTDDFLAVLFPTLAYIEDELGAKPDRVLLCGFGPDSRSFAEEWGAELGIVADTINSRFGLPGPFNAGLLGYLEGSGVTQ